MLVLTRLQGEAIMIGDDIEITVLEVHGDRVRLGIRAPRDVSIHRKEIYQAIQEANLEAAKGDAAGLPGLGELGRRLVPPPGKKPDFPLKSGQEAADNPE